MNLSTFQANYQLAGRISRSNGGIVTQSTIMGWLQAGIGAERADAMARAKLDEAKAKARSDWLTRSIRIELLHRGA